MYQFNCECKGCISKISSFVQTRNINIMEYYLFIFKKKLFFKLL